MGRKNRNARNMGVNQYQSFASLKNTTMKFDLTKGSFITKSSQRYNKANSDDEFRLSINYEESKDKFFVHLSIRKDIAETMIKGSGSLWACGIVKEGNFERLYMIPDENGYKLYTSTATSGGTRYYVRMPIADDKAAFEKYAGIHTMMYDNYNKAYYITEDE